MAKKIAIIKSSEGAATAAPSAVPPAALPAAPAAAPAATTPPALDGAVQLPTEGPPAEAFAGLPQGGVFRRIGGRLVPIGRNVGTVGPTTSPGSAMPLMSGPPAVTAAVARVHNSLFMPTPPEEQQALAAINGIKLNFQHSFSTLQHAVTEAQHVLDYLATDTTAASVFTREGIDLQQVKDFITAGNALLDKFAPPVAKPAA